MSETSVPDASGKRPREETARLSARGYARLSTAILYFLGAYILFAPWLAPRWLGWTLLAETVGGEPVLLRILVGLLFLYFATLTQEKYALKFLTRSILHAFNIYLYGPDYQQHRAAVAEQIQRLLSPNEAARTAAHRVLRRMTGQAFGPDHPSWAVWWERARHTFRLARETGPAAAADGARTAEHGDPEN
ncbi:MAG: hypothetical protein JXQ29_05160 [Planctomycetes bacterium]|nr:hypothetical protein [Planctomycetota bacterium]